MPQGQIERAETEAEEEGEGEEMEGDRDKETPRRTLLEVTRVGGGVPPPEENTDLPGFTPERAHLLLQGVYGNFPHHNNGSHMDRGITGGALWQRCWRQLAAQLAS